MPDSRDADWLGACRRAAAAVATLLDDSGANAGRLELTGSTGEGGDRTLVIDAAAEDAVFAELEALHAAGARFSALSEERGEVDLGGGDLRVVIDPIDGSTNAKRGLGHYALSIAVADGPTMGDVLFAFVHDFGPAEEWTATRGEGAFLDGQRLDPDVEERRSEDGRLELLGLENTDPRNVLAAGETLVGAAHRLRGIGAMAISLCCVAAGRMDGMVSLGSTRAVDVAAGQLIVREGGGLVAFTAYEDPLGAPLDLPAHSPLVAARSASSLDALRAVAPAP